MVALPPKRLRDLVPYQPPGPAWRIWSRFHYAGEWTPWEARSSLSEEYKAADVLVYLRAERAMHAGEDDDDDDFRREFRASRER